MEEILRYNNKQTSEDKAMCELLMNEIQKALPEAESKIWHGSPVWFLNDNPIVGYHKLKACVRILFWSGKSFDEEGLVPGKKFQDASASYTSIEQIDTKMLKRWLAKSRDIQWNYKDIVKNKGKLSRI